LHARFGRYICCGFLLGQVDFMKAIWVEFGCPGHGKGPWDGLGAMVKTKISRDITNEQCRTPTGRIESPIEAAIHARATFCTDEWLREHAYMQINEIVVMYTSTRLRLTGRACRLISRLSTASSRSTPSSCWAMGCCAHASRAAGAPHARRRAVVRISRTSGAARWRWRAARGSISRCGGTITSTPAKGFALVIMPTLVPMLRHAAAHIT
jgi:hypothetical protein